MVSFIGCDEVSPVIMFLSFVPLPNVIRHTNLQCTLVKPVFTAAYCHGLEGNFTLVLELYCVEVSTMLIIYAR